MTWAARNQRKGGHLPPCVHLFVRGQRAMCGVFVPLRARFVASSSLPMCSGCLRKSEKAKP